MFAGEVTIGAMMQSQGAFLAVVTAISWFPINYLKLVQWTAQSRRLIGMNNALDQAELPGITARRSEREDIEARSLALDLPSGEPLANVGDWKMGGASSGLCAALPASARARCCARSPACGRMGRGQLALPVAARVMFLPQRSYIPTESLKAALCYPAHQREFTDEACRKVLRECRLGQLAGSLGESARWAQRLSGGEQQRLAFARAILAKPDFLFLDEATSALDRATETALYELLAKRLPVTTVVSVAHSVNVEKFHDHVLDLRPGRGAATAPLKAAA